MDKTILLTGASGLIGRALLAGLVAENYNVIYTSRCDKKILSIDSQFAERHVSVRGINVDLCKEDSFQVILDFIQQEKIGQLFGLVNNARDASTLTMNENGLVTRDNFQKEFLMNVVVPYELSINLANSGHKLNAIVNIGSMYGGVAANPNLYDDHLTQSPLHYGVTKAGVAHLTKELAVRMSSISTRVNCVAFGGVSSDRVNSEFKRRYEKMVPSGKMLHSEETVGPVVFLLSDASSAINGQTIYADGGWSIW